MENRFCEDVKSHSDTVGHKYKVRGVVQDGVFKSTKMLNTILLLYLGFGLLMSVTICFTLHWSVRQQ